MPTDASDTFVRIGARDNFYQSCAYIPMSFALVTTLGEDGLTGIGPHALCFPFHVTEPHAMLLISRGSSATSANIRRTGRCALNYVEHDADWLQAIARLGYPGQDPEEKRRANPFQLERSPRESDAEDTAYPKIISEAFQVFECSWDQSVDLSMPGDPLPPGSTGKFVLRIDDILLKKQFREGVEQGSHFPRMPIFMGFRAGGDFWFAAHEPPFPVPAPKVAGTERQVVHYLANRLDERIRFSDAACAMLTKVPRPFLHQALSGIVAEARSRGIVQVTPEFLEELEKLRALP